MLSLVLTAAALVAQAAALVSNSSVNSQIRLAYSGPTGMVVSWNTFQQLSQPTVRYGLSADELVYSASSNVSVTYPTSLTYNNHVKITGLQPDTVYYYMPSSILPNETAPGPYTFKTSRPAGNMKPYTVAMVADLGTMGSEGLGTTSGKGVKPNGILKPGEKNTIDSLAANIASYDFLLHPGDISYADYWLKEETQGYLPNTTTADGAKVYESILNEFYDDMERITATRPYLVGPGNHEANCDNGGTAGFTASICLPGQTNFTGFINHFRMPSDVSGGLGNFWYSFDYGSVHYVFFDTETDLGHGLVGPDEPPSTENSGPFGLLNQQISWLTSDLASIDRCKTPWVIALGHRPWFVSGSPCTNCSAAFSSLLEEYGVDMVLQGHVHVYQRNLPVFANGTVDPAGYNNPSGVVYLINGAAGHYDGLDSFVPPLEPYQAYGIDVSNSTYGWSRIHFFNETHLQHDFIASNNDSVVDSMVLYKNHTICSAASTSSSASSSPLPTSSSTASSGVSSATTSAPLVTSTVKTTTVITTTKCATTVANCPAESTVLMTSTIDLYTTVCPAAEATNSGASAPATAAAGGASASTAYATEVVTVTSCPPSVANCPARVITTSYPVAITRKPVSGNYTAPASSPKPSSAASSAGSKPESGSSSSTSKAGSTNATAPAKTTSPVLAGGDTLAVSVAAFWLAAGALVALL